MAPRWGPTWSLLQRSAAGSGLRSLREQGNSPRGGKRVADAKVPSGSAVRVPAPGEGVSGDAGSGVADRTGACVAMSAGAAGPDVGGFPAGKRVADSVACAAGVAVSVITMSVGAAAGFTVKASNTAPTIRSMTATEARASTLSPKALP